MTTGRRTAYFTIVLLPDAQDPPNVSRGASGASFA
jgi:hypothetical protein